ncbi:MAG: ABC transporter ATP-binding protein [Nitrospinae bacterium]|nr:ABC transporter ATP-binding protein [Nitrospinota bacterium]
MSTVIQIEKLSKQYHIQTKKRERYTALRDVISNGARNLWNHVPKLFNPSTLQPFTPSTKEEFWALKDINLEIHQGDRVGIIGRNGAGKSTLLKILSRITEPTSGKISIKGRVASLLEVGTGFHPELTGRENIYLNGAILGMSRADIRKKFDEIVAFAEVEKFLDTPVKHYSSGMYVRLAFAVAAHLEPEILIVDEVLAVGDALFQKKCLGKMGEAAMGGRTVLFVSHNMAAVQTLCTKVIQLRAGEIKGCGSADEQIGLYLNSVQSKKDISFKSTVWLGVNLQLRRFEFSPNPVESGSEQEFLLELWSDKPMRIEGLTILVYSSLGIRIAILDLRQEHLLYHLDGLKPLTIRGRIESMCLVEGSYNVGLYITCAEVRKNFLDLVTIIVTSKKTDDKMVPYQPEVRGVVELDYTVSCRIDSQV